MHQVLIRATALLRRPGVLLVCLALAVGGSGLAWLPLFGLPGFELSLALSIAVGLLGGIAGIAAGHQEQRLILGRDPRPKGAQRSDSALLSAYRAIASSFVLLALCLALPFVVSTVFALLSTACNPFSMVGFFPLLTLPSALLACAAGVLTGMASAKGWSGYLRYLALVLLSLVPTVWPLYWGPQVFAFNHFLGYFPGPLYDEALTLPPKLYLFRLETLLVTLFLWLLIAFFLDMRDATLRRPHLRPGAFALLGLVGVALLLFEMRAPQLGLRMSDDALAERLGGRRETPHFVLHYPRGKPRFEVDRIERDLEFQFARIARLLDVTPRERIRVWIYRTPEEKRDLVGASRTQFAKPWRNEAHVNDMPFPHPVLRHELVHVMAAPLAPLPFRGTARLFGLWPHMGIIEGMAVAGEDSVHELTLHEWAAGMRRQKLAPDIRRIMGIRGFYAQSAARAYTLAGSFIRYLIQQHGTQKVQAFYRHGDFEGVYGEPLDAVATRWESFLDSLPLDDAAVHSAFARFRQGSLFSRPCAREVASLERDARDLLRGDPEKAFSLFQRCSALQPAEPVHLIGQSRALLELGKWKEASQLLEEARKGREEPAILAMFHMEEATIAARAGELEAARKHLETVLSLDPHPTAERTALVKLAALSSPEVGPAIWAYFGDEEGDVKLLRLREARDHSPGNPYPPYLLARRLLLRGEEPRLALPYLTQALSGELPDIFRKEASSLEVQALYLAGDCNGVRARVGALPDYGRGFVQETSEWAERCAFEEANYSSVLVPTETFR